MKLIQTLEGLVAAGLLLATTTPLGDAKPKELVTCDQFVSGIGMRYQAKPDAGHSIELVLPISGKTGTCIADGLKGEGYYVETFKDDNGNIVRFNVTMHSGKEY